jgi:Ca2+-binding RTX toxin-like protein
VVVRLKEGDGVEVGSFRDFGTAMEGAQEVIEQFSTATEGQWPFYAGRFIRPDLIVSVDVVERRERALGPPTRRTPLGRVGIAAGASSALPRTPNLVLRKSLQFTQRDLMGGSFTERSRLAPSTEVPMVRKLIVLALALGVGLAVTGVAGARWFNVIRGTRGDDVIAGTARPDYILGLAGNDQISAAEGRDFVYGGKGNDAIDGGPGLDHLFGGPGDDTITAGNGRAVAWGGYGNDTLTAGENGLSRLHGGPGDDTLNGGSQRDFLWGGRGVDHEFGGDGNDVLHALAADGQVDTLDCGPGDHDVAWLRAGESDVTTNCELVKTVTIGSDG